MSKGLSTTALILGILGLVLFWLPVIGLLLGIGALVFGIMGLKQVKGAAIAGIIMGSIATLLGLLMIIGMFAYFSVLDPSNLTPPNCIPPAGFDCVNQESGNGMVNIMLKNNQGTRIAISEAFIEDHKGNREDCKLTTPNQPSSDQVFVDSDKTFQLTCLSNNVEKLDSKYRLAFVFTHQREGGSFPSIVDGFVSVN